MNHEAFKECADVMDLVCEICKRHGFESVDVRAYADGMRTFQVLDKDGRLDSYHEGRIDDDD